MCVVESTFYVHPNGVEQEIGNVNRYCTRSNGMSLCPNVHYRDVKTNGPDPGSPSYSVASPASLSHPSTPIQYREVRPTVVVDSRNANDGETKKPRRKSISTRVQISIGSSSKDKGKEREKRYNRRSADSTVTTGSDYSTYYPEPRSNRESMLASSPLRYSPQSAYAGSAYQTETQTPPPPPPPPRNPPVAAGYPDSPPPGPRRKAKKAVLHHDEDVAREILPRADARAHIRNEERSRREVERREHDIRREQDDARKERDRGNHRENQRLAARLAREQKDKTQREDDERRAQQESDARAAERAHLRAMEQEAPRPTRARRESVRGRRPSLRPEDRPAVQELKANMAAERAKQEETERLEAMEQQYRNQYSEQPYHTPARDPYDPRLGAPFDQHRPLRHETRNIGSDYNTTYPHAGTGYHSPIQPRFREVVPGPSDLHERGQQVLEDARNSSRALHDQMDDLTVDDDVFSDPERRSLHRRNTSSGGGTSGGRRRKPYFK